MPPSLSQAEQDLLDDKAAGVLEKVYGNAQSDISARLAEASDLEKLDKRALSRILSETNQIVDDLQERGAAWARAVSPRSFDKGIRIASGRLSLDAEEMIEQIDREAVRAVAGQIAADLGVANDGIKRLAGRFIRATQQKLIEEERINELIAEGLATGDARRTVSKAIVSELEEAVDEGKLIPIRCKDGKTRHYTMRAYGRMVATAKMRQASTQGVISTCQQIGNDLVQVSVHADSCPICLPYQSKVYSITGSDPDFPALEARPPWHPHCRHILLPVTREALEERGEIEALSKLSKSDSSVFGIEDYLSRIGEREIPDVSGPDPEWNAAYQLWQNPKRKRYPATTSAKQYYEENPIPSKVDELPAEITNGEEAAKWLVRRHPHLQVNLSPVATHQKELPTETIRRITKEVDDLMIDFPITAKSVNAIKFDTLDGDWFGRADHISYQRGSDILINSNKLSQIDPERFYVRGESAPPRKFTLDNGEIAWGRNYISTSPEDIVAHEFGHVIQHEAEIRTNLAVNRVASNIDLSVGLTRLSLVDYDGETYIPVSMYARSNNREFWAEAFTLFRRGMEKWKRIARKKKPIKRVESFFRFLEGSTYSEVEDASIEEIEDAIEEGAM